MKLEIEFEAEADGDGSLDLNVLEMTLDGRNLPYIKVQIDSRMQRAMHEMLQRIHRLLPKDWNL